MAGPSAPPLPVPPSAAPRFVRTGRVRLGQAPEVLAAGPDGVGSTGTLANSLYLAEQALRDHWPRMLSALRQVPLGSERALVFALHPAGGPITLRLGEDGTARMEGATAVAGLGYHRFLDEVAAALGDAVGVRWDPAEEPPLEPWFLAWLRAQAQEALTAWLSDPPRGAVHWLVPLAPPVGHWQGRGAVATMVGPRPEAWLQAVVADPTLGTDAFPWWAEGLGPTTLVGRARCVLWRDVRWRPPSTADELAALAEVGNLLAEAWEADPGLDDAPWAAWAEVLSLLGEAESRRERVLRRAAPGAPEGYRRHLVVEPLPGGWHITLPGSMGVSWTEEEGWCAWDEGRTAWFSALYTDEDPPWPEGEVVDELAAEDGSARLCTTRDEAGDTVQVLSGRRRRGDQLAVLTLAWQDDPGGRAWAEAAWRSLDRDG